MRSVARRFQLVDGDLEPGLLVGRQENRLALRQGDRLGVGGPVRRGHEHLVARIEQRGERVEDGLLAAVGDEHLAGFDDVARIAHRLLRDGGAQFGQPRRGRVLVVPRVAAGGDGGLDDVVGRGEVGFAGAEADDVLARGGQRLGLGVDGQGGRLGHRCNQSGDSCHACHAGTVTEGQIPDIRIPDAIKPGDGRFGSGPSKVRPEAVAGLAAAGPELPGHKPPPELVSAPSSAACAVGYRSCSGCLRTTRSSSATAGQPRSGMRPPSASSSGAASTSHSASSAASSPQRRRPRRISRRHTSSSRRLAPTPSSRPAPMSTCTPSPTTRRPPA